MTTLQTLKVRKKDVISKLQKEYKRFSSRKNVGIYISEVAENLEISFTTAKNYMTGIAKDGYLAEAILTELKKIK
jgi:hypothetical protein